MRCTKKCTRGVSATHANREQDPQSGGESKWLHIALSQGSQSEEESKLSPDPYQLRVPRVVSKNAGTTNILQKVLTLCNALKSPPQSSFTEKVSNFLEPPPPPRLGLMA